MYKVIVNFKDLQDGNYAYKVGDEFPRKGKTASAERLKELSGSNNKRHTPLIADGKDAAKKAEPKAKKSAEAKVEAKAEDNTSAE